jgi:hypothetical protein
MATPSRLRDSTQIVLPEGTLEGIAPDLESDFSVTISEEETRVRIIGSPIVIKNVTAYLTRHGVRLP